MINPKRIVCLLFLLPLILVTTSCNDDSITKNNETKLTGFYKAVTFTEAGSRDELVDILANGGELTAQFTENYTVSGHLFIPDSIETNYSPIDTNYSGTFTLKADTVWFKNTLLFLDNPAVYFLVKGAKLETPDYQGWGAPFKIILEKQ